MSWGYDEARMISESIKYFADTLRDIVKLVIEAVAAAEGR